MGPKDANARPVRASFTASKSGPKEERFNLEGATAIIQGFGNVGSHAASLLAKLGVSTIATGDHTGYLRNEEGFNAHKLTEYVKANGSIEGYPRGEKISRTEFFETAADICIPAALENQIGEAEANALQVRLVAEGANGPVNPDGEAVLLDRRIPIIPDVLANSGGVTVSYYEWVQNRNSEHWDVEKVDAKLLHMMRRGYQRTMFFAQKHRVEPAYRGVRLRARKPRDVVRRTRHLPVIG